MLKSFQLGISVVALSLPFIAAPAFSNDYYCYYIDGNGQTINLQHLCNPGASDVSFQPTLITTGLPSATTNAIANYRTFLNAQGVTFVLQGNYVGRDQVDLAWEVWSTRGRGFYYFLKGSATQVNGDADVIAYFNSNTVFTNEQELYGCYYGNNCSATWVQRRSTAPFSCLAPWQIGTNGRQCGTSARIQNF